MRLQDIFGTPTVAKLLDALLENPTLVWGQGHLARRLNIDRATMRCTLARLQTLGLVSIDVNPVGVRVNAIMFNNETEQGKALLAFCRRIADLKHVLTNKTHTP
jgi:DNA-binding MarR family transcriptional regulator